MNDDEQLDWRGALAPVDLAATRVCRALGHAFEGRLLSETHVIGRCARCGAGVLSDGS